jgi:hypothetical protein
MNVTLVYLDIILMMGSVSRFARVLAKNACRLKFVGGALWGFILVLMHVCLALNFVINVLMEKSVLLARKGMF